ncbi:MAG: redox-regulated ATPase YchF [Candidatus Paceibacterota bacterium]
MSHCTLNIGIVGLPNVGKSTLFNALTRKSVDAANYPFCTIDPAVGVVPVPDERLWKLSTFSASAQTLPAVVEFVDIAGLVKGAAEGEGLGNAFLSNIREVDAIAHVVRIFDDSNITHVSGTVDPLADIETVHLELIFADLDTVNKRLASLERDVKRGDKDAVKENAVVARAKATLEASQLISSLELTEDEQIYLPGLHLLTAKPILFVLNKQSGGTNIDESDPEAFEKLTRAIEVMGARYVLVDANVESEVKELEGAEKQLFREELGAKDSGFDTFIQQSYDLLDLITFFTTGEKETRAWTTFVGATAPQAGASIHSDFQDTFIRADIIQWDALLAAGSRAAARDQGRIRTEGKEYVVQDGDVIEFKI